jgi:hypothetical protein
MKWLDKRSMRIAKQEEAKKQWHPYFCWKPVWINGHYFWLETVERKQVKQHRYVDVDHWIYLELGANESWSLDALNHVVRCNRDGKVVK